MSSAQIGPQLGQKPPRLSRIGELAGRSWQLYKKRLNVFSLVYVFYLTLLLLIWGLCDSVWNKFPHPLNPLVTAWIAAGVLMAVLVNFWGQASFIYAISEPALLARPVFQKAARVIWRFAWLYLLFVALMAVGFMLFIAPVEILGGRRPDQLAAMGAALFVVSGIVLMAVLLVWFAFSFFILVREGKTGMEALLASREYVKGSWRPVFLRLFAVGAPAYLLGLLPVAGPLLSLLLMPFLMAYTYYIYEDLVSLKGAVRRPSGRERLGWSVLAAAGAILTAVAVVYTLGHANLRKALLQGLVMKPAPALTAPAPSGKGGGKIPSGAGFLNKI